MIMWQLYWSERLTWVKRWEASTKWRKANKAPIKRATCPVAICSVLVPPATAEKRIITKRICSWENTWQQDMRKIRLQAETFQICTVKKSTLHWKQQTYQKSLQRGLCHRRIPWRRHLGCGMWMVRGNDLHCGNDPLKHHGHQNSENVNDLRFNTAFIFKLSSHFHQHLTITQQPSLLGLDT